MIMSPTSHILVLLRVTRLEPCQGDWRASHHSMDRLSTGNLSRPQFVDCTMTKIGHGLSKVLTCSVTISKSLSRRWRSPLNELWVACLQTSPSSLKKGSTKLQLKSRTAKTNSNSRMPASRTRRTRSGHTSWILRRWALQGRCCQCPQELWSTIHDQGESTIHHTAWQHDVPCRFQAYSGYFKTPRPDRQLDCQGSHGGHGCREWERVGRYSYVVIPSVTIWARLWFKDERRVRAHDEDDWKKLCQGRQTNGFHACLSSSSSHRQVIEGWKG